MNINRKATELLECKERYLVPCTSHFYDDPPVLQRGEGLYVYDSDDKMYLDLFSGVSVNHLGHCHPKITQAIQDQSAQLCHTTTIYLTEPMLDLAKDLVRISPSSLGKVFFCVSGSEANESAALIAQHFDQKTAVVSLDNSLHGNTRFALSITGVGFWKSDLAPVADTTLAVSPYCYRCPMGKDEATCNLECADDLENKIKTSKRPIGILFIEIIQGNGGFVVPPAKWFERIKEITQKYSVLVAVDEVQTGFGRTGKMFACEHFDLQPDFITVAKSIGGGLPMGAVLVADHVAREFTMPRASTFGGNLVSAKAALAFLSVLEQDNLVAHAATMGDYFKESLLELQTVFAVIGDVRGLGLMLGIELVGADKKPDAALTDYVLEELKDAGILAGKSGQGRNVVCFLPPLIISKGEIDFSVKTLKDILENY